MWITLLLLLQTMRVVVRTAVELFKKKNQVCTDTRIQLPTYITLANVCRSIGIHYTQLAECNNILQHNAIFIAYVTNDSCMFRCRVPTQNP